MTEEELRKIAKEEMAKSIMDNLDSALIFTYIKNLEEENKQLKFDCKQAEDLKHFFMNERDKLQKENENAKWYVHQMIVRISEDIADYIDDDKIGNNHIIRELKERRKQWQDVEKLLNGESKDNLYNDWRKYGEYE